MVRCLFLEGIGGGGGGALGAATAGDSEGEGGGAEMKGHKEEGGEELHGG